MPTDTDAHRDRREREAWGFAMGTVLVCIATLVIGNKLPPRDTMGMDVTAVVLAVVFGTSCGYLWWWHMAGDLPLSARRALFHAGAVVFCVLSCASIVAGAVVAAGLNGAFIMHPRFLPSWVQMDVMLVRKFALPLLALMIPWALLWRFIVNRRHAARMIA